MQTFITLTAMAAIFAAHVAMMTELRPRGATTPKDDQESNSGESS